MATNCITKPFDVIAVGELTIMPVLLSLVVVVHW